jgi:hypothetical protein
MAEPFPRGDGGDLQAYAPPSRPPREQRLKWSLQVPAVPGFSLPPSLRVDVPGRASRVELDAELLEHLGKRPVPAETTAADALGVAMLYVGASIGVKPRGLSDVARRPPARAA